MGATTTRTPCGESTVRTLMDQVIRVNQFLGVFPHEIVGTHLNFRWNSRYFFKTLINLGILVVYLGYLDFQLVRSLYKAEDILVLVQIWYWMALVSISVLVLILCVVKRNEFTFFFEKSNGMKEKMRGFVDCDKAILYSRRIYKFYVIIALVSATLFGIEFLFRPHKHVSFLHHVQDPTTTQTVLNALFQSYISLISSAALSFVEVLCPSLARSISNSIHRIREALMEEVNKLTEMAESNMEKYTNQDNEKGPMVLLTEIVRRTPKKTGGGIGYITKAMERFGFIAERQGAINCIFGTILALNTAWLVTSVCLLIFLEIRLLNPRADPDELEGMSWRMVLIIWSCVSCSIRLVILLISIGSVHSASICFQGALTGSILRAESPRSQELKLINIQLISYELNPVAVSAGGFFIFSRATILYVISIVTTYLVFLLQA